MEAGLVIGRPGLATARRAAVEVRSGEKRVGCGLLLRLPSGRVVVLTCHHVVAPVAPEALAVVVRRDEAVTIPAAYDADASRPKADVAVLGLAEGVDDVENPLLHVPEWHHYTGRLEAQALAPGTQAELFQTALQAGRSVTIGDYALPRAFGLGDPEDTKPGTSGSPVLCEDGIVGLVHFGRDEVARESRASLLNPLTEWCETLPELAGLIQPFTTKALRQRADVFRAAARPALKIRGYRPELYHPRAADAEARTAFEEATAVCLVGRHNSGKTRLVEQLLRDHPDALVVFTRTTEPPPELGEDSWFQDREIVVLCENVHAAEREWKPLQWYERFSPPMARRTVLVLTSRNAADWQRVSEAQSGVLESLEARKVFLSTNEGHDLTWEEAWELGRALGLDEEECRRRFDGTPGSLVVDEDEKPGTPEKLPAGRNGAATPAIVAEQGVAVPHNLPHVTSSFVGRDREMRELSELLSVSALVTVTGATGVGKTRLALQVASTIADRFPDGICWVELGAIVDPRQVVPAIAAELSLSEPARASLDGALVEALRDRRRLLVLNDPDQVQKATMALVARLTAGEPRLRVLVTGHDPLGLPWEEVCELQPLAPAGDAASAAGELFRDRLDDEGAADDAEIDTLCAELEGNPAALEIAAAQVQDTGVEGAAAARERHPKAGADGGVLDLAVTRSLEDMDPRAAPVFERLAVFPEWFTLPAARAVAEGPEVDGAAVPEILRSLVDRALVIVDERDPHAERYRLLVSVRDIAHARLKASLQLTDARRRHAMHYLAVAEKGSRRMHGQSGRQWTDRLMRDRAHFRAVARWAIEHGDRLTGWRLGAALWQLFLVRSRFTEGRQRLAELLSLRDPARPDELSDEEAAALAELLAGGGYLAYHQGDYEAAARHHEDALALRRRLGDGPEVADPLNMLGLVARRRGEFAVARERLEEAMAVSRRHDDFARLADLLNSLGNAIREDGGSPEEAMSLQDQSFGMYARLGSERGCAMARCDTGSLLADAGDLAAAREAFDRARALYERVGDEQGLAQALNGLARVDRLEGRVAEAIECHGRALETFDRLGDKLRVAETLEALAVAHAAAGERAGAEEHLRMADEVRDAIGAPRPPVQRAEVAAALGRG